MLFILTASMLFVSYLFFLRLYLLIFEVLRITVFLDSVSSKNIYIYIFSSRIRPTSEFIFVIPSAFVFRQDDAR